MWFFWNKSILDFLVITDLGNDLYSKKLNDETVYCLYTDALEAIVKMQTKVDCAGLQDFDIFYEEENNLFIVNSNGINVEVYGTRSFHSDTSKS